MLRRGFLLRKKEEPTKFPLREFVEKLPGVYEEDVLLGDTLSETDLKLFSWTNKACRDAMRKAKKDEEAETKMKFKVTEITSISVLEWAWERVPFKSEIPERKERFAIVAPRGNVELVCWL